MAITARHAQPEDDLTVLWPETAEHELNREQVFVVTESTGQIVAGLLMFHGGHTLAYAGSIVFATQERQGLIAYRLMECVRQWCRSHDIRLLGHGAGTLECCQTFLRMGAQITRHHTFMEMVITEKEGSRG